MGSVHDEYRVVTLARWNAAQAAALGNAETRSDTQQNNALMLALAHVSLAVELQRDHEAMQTAGRRHIRMIGTTADQPR